MTKVLTACASTVGPVVFVLKIPLLTPSVVDTRLVSPFIFRTVSTIIKSSTAATLSGKLAAWRSIVVGGPICGVRR